MFVRLHISNWYINKKKKKSWLDLCMTWMTVVSILLQILFFLVLLSNLFHHCISHIDCSTRFHWQQLNRQVVINRNLWLFFNAFKFNIDSYLNKLRHRNAFNTRETFTLHRNFSADFFCIFTSQNLWFIAKAKCYYKQYIKKMAACRSSEHLHLCAVFTVHSVSVPNKQTPYNIHRQWK